MGWVRAQQKLGGWLALFALVLQLAVSFGHIHAEDFAALNPGVVTLAHADENPAEDSDHHGLVHADCAICAVIHLAAALLLPPPQVPLPITDTFAWLAASEHSDFSRAPPRPFQARAPPQA